MYAFGTRFRQQPFANPFQGFNPSALQNEVLDDPQMVYGAFRSGLGAPAGSRFGQYADQWMRDLYPEFQGQMAMGQTAPDLPFWQYAQQQFGRLQGDYNLAASQQRSPVRRTRLLTRY